MHWVWINKEWLFSGVGVAIAGTVLAFFFRRRVASANTSVVQASAMIGSPVATGSNISQTVNLTIEVPQPAEVIDDYAAKPTPEEIYSQISKLPALLQREARRSYQGIKVRWRGKLQSINTIQEFGGRSAASIRSVGSTHYANFTVTEMASFPTLVQVPVNIEQIPRLKVSHAGTPIEVCGKISQVGFSIRLEEATLTILD